MNFIGKTAVVTGGSRGIGRAICLELARGGANIMLCYAGNEQAALDTVSACEALGAKAAAMRCDVSKAEPAQQSLSLLGILMSPIWFTVASFTPVSYTHLDVYKRQVDKSGEAPAEEAAEEAPAAETAAPAEAEAPAAE